MKTSIGCFYKTLLIFSVFIFACGGEEKKDNPPKVTNIDISKLNSYSNQYTMISAQPSAKPESNSAPTTTYSFTLSSIAGSYIAPSISHFEFAQENILTSKNTVYRSGQIICDNIMRQKENELLASGKPQLSKKSLTGIYRSAPSSIIVGTPWNGVWILNSATTMTTINTTCRAITTHAYFFIDNNDTAAMSGYLSDYCTAFESIYTENHSKFGEENDVDSNTHVIIVFSSKLENISGLLGYFNSADKYAYNATTNPYSNEGDIFYMTTASSYQGDTIEATLAHEFQHMIYFDEHVSRGVTNTYTWLNEALSQAAEYYNGYDSSTSNHISWIKNYLTGDYWEGLSLTHWTDYNYGYGAVFIRYLIDQYGNSAIYNMCSTNKIGIAAVEAATGTDFNTIFNNFTISLVLSDVSSNSNPLYKFTSLDLETVQPNGRKGLTTSYTASAGASADWWLYPYEIWFVHWSGTFKSMAVTGNEITSTPIGY
jgi:hypothetical protein